MRKLQAQAKATVVLGCILSWSVVRSMLDGDISSSSAATRIALAFVLAYAGVLLVVTVVKGYLPEPEPEPEEEATPDDGVEDAVLVEADPFALPEESMVDADEAP